MADYKKSSGVKAEAQLLDPKDFQVMVENMMDIKGIIDMVKRSKAGTVAIGEGSHGTKEFYANRCEITKELIKDKRCNGVLIEGDWPDTAALHRFVMGMSSASVDEAMGGYLNFPRWMWRNETTKDFLLWLHGHNKALPVRERVGIFGMDVYSLHLSMDAVMKHLSTLGDAQTAGMVQRDYSCFDKFGDDAQRYGQLTQLGNIKGCREAAVRALSLVNEQVKQYAHLAPERDADEALFKAEDAFIARMNAEVVVDAEQYYRSMFDPTENSWNIRDTHFFNTFTKVQEHLRATRGTGQCVVWAHNSHLGDARHTHLDASRFTSGTELNLGQLLRQKLGDDVLLVGQLTNTGKVLASDDWGGCGKVKAVRDALAGSFEAFFRDCARKAKITDFALDLRIPEVKKVLVNSGSVKLERAIGVIYRPQSERMSHYYFCDIAQQFDLLCFFESTAPVVPLDKDAASVLANEPETFPSGY